MSPWRSELNVLLVKHPVDNLNYLTFPVAHKHRILGTFKHIFKLHMNRYNPPHKHHPLCSGLTIDTTSTYTQDNTQLPMYILCLIVSVYFDMLWTGNSLTNILFWLFIIITTNTIISISISTVTIFSTTKLSVTLIINIIIIIIINIITINGFSWICFYKRNNMLYIVILAIRRLLTSY